MAARLGVQLHEVMGWHGPLTWRQMRAWDAWMGLELNDPDRSDFYLMQVATEIRRGNVKKPGDVHVKDLLLKFEDKKRVPPTAEQVSMWGRARAFARAGGKMQRPDGKFVDAHGRVVG